MAAEVHANKAPTALGEIECDKVGKNYHTAVESLRRYRRVPQQHQVAYGRAQQRIGHQQ